MKAITLIQPWATLIAIGEKKIETRSWKTSYRGPLMIHAGKKIYKEICNQEPFKSVLAKHGYSAENLPTGVIIAKCDLTDCLRMTDCMLRDLRVVCANLENGQAVTGNEIEFGDYAPGRYGWTLDNVEMLKEPIPAKGQLSLWEYPEEVK